MEYKYVNMKLNDGEFYYFSDARVDIFGEFHIITYSNSRFCVRTDSISRIYMRA